MKIYISTCQAPFNFIIIASASFDNDAAGDAAALEFINQQYAAWWKDNNGDRCCKNNADQELFEPFEKLNYALASKDLWGGENHFISMCDQGDLEGITERFYSAEFGDRKNWPGYLRNALGDGASTEVAEVHAYYSGKRH